MKHSQETNKKEIQNQADVYTSTQQHLSLDPFSRLVGHSNSTIPVCNCVSGIRFLSSVFIITNNNQGKYILPLMLTTSCLLCLFPVFTMFLVIGDPLLPQVWLESHFTFNDMENIHDVESKHVPGCSTSHKWNCMPCAHPEQSQNLSVCKTSLHSTWQPPQ